MRNTLIMFFEQQRPHAIRGTIEVDVTETLARIRVIEKQVRIAVSFHAFGIHCVARALEQHPELNTYRRGDKLLAFQDVDVLSPIDKRLPGGVRIPVGHICRAAQKKSLADINWELRNAIQASDLADDEAVRMRRKVAAAPWWVRRAIGWWMSRDPYRLKRSHGTVLVSTTRILGFSQPTFIIAGTVHTLSLAFGNITERLRLNEQGQIEKRKILCLSGAIDHDVVDGMAIARFCQSLVHLLEAGEGLDAQMASATKSLIEDDRHARR